MSSQYWEDPISMLDEDQLQELLTEVYMNEGWDVKNMHRIDPKSENGADLEIRRGSETILIAVKDKPRTKDVDQLRRLWSRRDEAVLIYVHSKPSTGGFAKESLQIENDIIFLTGKKLHDFFIENECISYLQLVFEVHPIVLEYSDALSVVWSNRKIVGSKESTRLDFENIYSLKKAVVKKRAAVGVFALKYDEIVNSMLTKDSKSFPGILDSVLSDLDIVQRFAGISLLDIVIHISRTTPHLLSRLWRLVIERTYWQEWAIMSERLNSAPEVSSFTRKYWVLPNINGVGESKFLGGNAIGFLSGVRDILESLSRSLRDLDVAIDWVWEKTPMKLPE